MLLSDKRRRIPAAELLPGTVFPYERILLTFADLRQVEEVFQLALHLAAGPRRELFLLRVVPGGRADDETRVDMEALYSEMRSINVLLQREGIPARLESAPAPGAASIAAYAAEREIDLIIVIGVAANDGMYRKLVEGLMRQAPCTAMLLCAADAHEERAAGRPVAQGADRPPLPMTA